MAAVTNTGEVTNPAITPEFCLERTAAFTEWANHPNRDGGEQEALNQLNEACFLTQCLAQQLIAFHARTAAMIKQLEALGAQPVVFVNHGDSERQFVEDVERLSCPACGGSGHAGDAGTLLERLLEEWQARSLAAHPSDAMLINRHVRELREALVSAQNASQHAERASVGVANG